MNRRDFVKVALGAILTPLVPITEEPVVFEQEMGELLIFENIESIEDIRAWGTDYISEQTKKEFFKNLFYATKSIECEKTDRTLISIS